VNWKRLLLEKPEIAAIYQDQFQHILVDEYQDTNTLQAEIVDLLAAEHRGLMVVGDDAQSIFSWRGANCANMLFNSGEGIRRRGSSGWRPTIDRPRRS
jgi:DNA helicase-2/ATP-dependent DNA helicase PcrA